MRTCLAVISLLLAAGLLAAQDKPESLVLNGDFENAGIWNMQTGAKRVARPDGGTCLEVNSETGVTQEIPADGLHGNFSVGCDVKTANIVPRGMGYAYVAVYQIDAQGELAAFHDYGQVQGTHDWQRFTWTFPVAPNAVTVSLRCGIFQASGKAWFDNWTLVPGDKPLNINEVTQPPTSGRPAPPTAAIFREPGLPVTGAASDPERLGKLLQQAGFTVDYLSAADLADRRKLRPALYNFVVLPYGESFPATARRSMTEYLHLGGSFISTGGYVFNRLLLPDGGKWTEEKDLVAAKLQEALNHSLLPDGGFETTGNDAPIGNTVLDGKWRRDGNNCTLVTEDPHEGHTCAKVIVSVDKPHEERWYLDMAPPKAGTCRVSGWMKSANVTGTGMAYLACYEYAGDKLIAWKDFGVARGTTPWTQYMFDFVPNPTTTHIHIKMGLYQANGTAWFDDIRLCAIGQAKPTPMNTATGSPGDGLGVAASQIGAFDAGFALKRVAKLQPGAEQFLFPGDGSLTGDVSGWAAAGIQGYDNARWIELLDGRDRFGRPRGAAGALMVNYNGYFSGSMWAFFGAENRDLFDGKSPWLDQGFVNTAKFMARGLFLRNLKTDMALYKPGEPVKYQVMVQNLSTSPQTCIVPFEIWAAGSRTPANAQVFQVKLAPGDSEVVEATWAAPQFTSDLYEVRARLHDGKQRLDAMTTGFMVQSPAVIAKGPQLRYKDNYLTLNGQPIFLFGSDTYGNSYKSATENPWTWHLDHVAARDFGFNLYENLQFCNPDYVYTEPEWRQFEAMAQSCQREGLVFMPCQLCGHEVGIGDELLAEEAAECAAYGEHMKPYPGLLYYLNGDFQFNREDKAALAAMWNQWLKDKYGTADALKAAWGDEVYGEWGKLAYPPPNAAAWDSTRAADLARFDIGITRRWVQRHVQGVRSQDADHPITSEYYQQPWGGLDLILTLGDQDVSNFGYFSSYPDDLERLPLCLRLNDLRVRGKSVALGEYGVKTHPAWSAENNPGGYHVQRTEEEQKELFMAVAAYGFAMGATKVQNWCLRDASENCFPWGVFYPNGRVPKDVAYWHRNLSLIWRFLRPKYVPAEVTVLQLDSLRLGAQGGRAVDAVFSSFRTLLAAGANFNVLNELNAGQLKPETKLLLWPAPYCPDDATYQRVLQFVQQGGKLLVTGDLSFNADRKRTRTERLKELCGVEFVKELAAPPQRGSEPQAVKLDGQDVTLTPAVEVKPTTATTLAPGVYRNKVGQGEVTYCTDPLELAVGAERPAALAALYRSFVPPRPVGRQYAYGKFHVITQPLQSGGWFTLAYPLQPLPGEGIRYPRIQVTDGEGRPVGLTLPETGRESVHPAEPGEAHALALSLDHKFLAESGAVLLAPLSAGKLQWPQTALHPVTLIGDLEGGKWRTLETHEGDGAITVDLDEDTMTCLVLVCERDEVGKWTALIEQAATRPWEVKGY